jgi:5-hydroxyisourate hydrolase-like protein (transthyretin family)
VDAADMYEYHVVGQLFCEGKPWANQDVELYDLDCWSPDDLLATAKTDAEGRFELRGQEKEGWGFNSWNSKYTIPTPYIYTKKGCVSFVCTLQNLYDPNARISDIKVF